MRIQKAEVRKVGTQLVVDGEWVKEEQEIVRFRNYGLVKLNNKFYLFVEPEYAGGFWNGVCVETKAAIALRKEFYGAKKGDPRGPKLSALIETAYNQNIW